MGTPSGTGDSVTTPMGGKARANTLTSFSLHGIQVCCELVSLASAGARASRFAVCGVFRGGAGVAAKPTTVRVGIFGDSSTLELEAGVFTCLLCLCLSPVTCHITTVLLPLKGGGPNQLPLLQTCLKVRVLLGVPEPRVPSILWDPKAESFSIHPYAKTQKYDIKILVCRCVFPAPTGTQQKWSSQGVRNTVCFYR